MTTTIVTTKGQVVIPAKIRKRLNIKKGTKLHVEERGDELVLRPVTPDYFNRIAGALQTRGKLSRALLEDRAKARKNEAER